jgi:hypothetical protein
MADEGLRAKPPPTASQQVTLWSLAAGHCLGSEAMAPGHTALLGHSGSDQAMALSIHAACLADLS